MQISKLMINQSNTFTGNIERKHRRSQRNYNFETGSTPNRNNTETVKECPDELLFTQPKNKNTDPMRTLSAILTALAVGGAIGYSAGEARGTEKGYNDGYNKGLEIVQSQAEDKQEAINPFSEGFTVTEYTPQTTTEPYTYADTEVELTGIPQNVTKLAGENKVITEIDLTKEVKLYSDNKEQAKLPNWLVNTKADREVVRQAQYNLGRIFQNGNNIYIYLKQDTTMGDIKGVYGIIDGVIGNYSENHLYDRPQTDSTTNNYDNAIVKAGEVIKLEWLTEKDGHLMFRYDNHHSDKSHSKIINAIEKYADDKFSYTK